MKSKPRTQVQRTGALAGSGGDIPGGVQFKNNHFTETCCGTEAGWYLRLIDSCTTQLKAQGPSRTCKERKEEEEEEEEERTLSPQLEVRCNGLGLSRVLVGTFLGLYIIVYGQFQVIILKGSGFKVEK